ncbi:MAG: hypothetical protein ACWGQW_01590 [bacterium]
MARRKKSLTRTIVVLGILTLAGFGLYTLYQDNKSTVNSNYSKVEKKAKAVKRALQD